MAQLKIEIEGHHLFGNSLMVRLGHHAARTRHGISLQWEKNDAGKGILGFCVSGSKVKNNLKLAYRRKTELMGKKVLLLTGTNDIMASNRYKWLYMKYTKLVDYLKSINCDIVLMTVPPIPALPKDDQRQELLIKFNDLVRHMAENKNLPLMDIYPLFMEGESINEAFFEKFYYKGRQDLLHWNRAGMERVLTFMEMTL